MWLSYKVAIIYVSCARNQNDTVFVKFASNRMFKVGP